MIQRSEYCNGYLQLGLQSVGPVVGCRPCGGTVSGGSDQTEGASARTWGSEAPRGPVEGSPFSGPSRGARLAHSVSERFIMVGHFSNDVFRDGQGCRRGR